MAAPILEKMVPLLVILLLLHVVSCKDKPVSVALNAKWSSTPYLLEASEFIANEGNDNFWMFLGMVTRDPPSAYHIESDRGHYELILRYASKVLSPLQMTLLKLSLSLRMYSPAVENYQRLANSEIPPADCSVFMNIHGKVSCDLTQLDVILSEIENRPKVPVFKFDHTYPGSSGSPVQVILYAELGEESFVRFHQVLSRLAESKKIHYVFRHRFTATEEQTRLSGYGVELALKSTEYKAKDDTKVDGGTGKEDEDEGDDEVQGFVFSKLRELHPEMTSDLKAFKQHLIASSTELAALKVWELQDLSLQAAQKVLNAGTEEALPVLTDLSQNFPSRTRSLVKIQVDENLKKEVKKNQDKFDSELNIAAGDSAIFLNGIPIDMELYDVFNLLDVMKSEANIMEGLYSLGFQAKDVSEFLKLDMKGKSKFALDIRHSAVQYLNDLENDARYRNWPSSVQDFLRPTFPGMLRHVAKNIFHLVFIVDPLDKDGEDLIKMAEAFVVHNAPIRVGFVLKVNFDLAKTGEDDIGIAVSRAFDYLYKEESPIKAISFITDIYERKKKSEITAKSVIADFMRINKDADKDLVFGSSDEYDTSRRGAMDFISRSGLKDFPQVLLNGVPLDKKYLNSESFEEGVVSTILSQTPSIQQHIYQGTLHDFVNILEYLMEEDNVLPRLNSRVLYNEEKNLDLTANIDPEIYKAPEMFSLMNSKDMASIMANNMLYMTRKDDDMLRSMTMWIVCDLETPEGRELLYASLKHLKHTHAMRVGVIFSTPSDDAKDNLFITRAVYTALTTLPSGQAKNFITKLAKEENVADLKAKKKTLKDLEVNGMDTEAYLAAFEAMDTKFLQVHHTFVEKVLAWPTSARGVVANGQIIGPLDDGEEFLEEDFSLLEKFKFNKGGSSLKNHLASLGKKDSGGTDLLMKVASLLSSSDSNQERKKVSFQSDKYSVVKLPADPSSPAYQMEVILDPASRDAQRISPILMVLKESVNIEIKIFMNCRDKLSEMPVKTYYRYVMEPEVSFNDDNTFSAGPRAKFTGLPQKSILTLGMHAPESWLVGVVKAAYDLDNILLEEVSNAIHADFALDYILLEGHCSDSTSGQPPRGLQFTLGVNSSDALQDTIVMANLGYFQLKANPGLWYLKLREGRSLELYDIQSHENTDTPKDMDDVVVVINSFQSKIIRVKVAKKPDKFHEQLLHDDQEDKSLWQSISSTITGEKKEEEKEVTLNIFSLASGHMYERLMRIMMLSVLKNTKSKVKFWFLKNYLSPSFKDFIPKMAKEYSFEFELVEYKWPRWLHQQKEKQRIMWGYKILFLDVLFPLDVKKIIFVDADQIVRTDLKELHDLDLGGAPYGYTPFCDSRREMEGFRFWKHGYWASHLAGRKYHISALYVVDLKKFRQVAAGDRLRGQYQGLSQDPNSLSNLDQDLPNNMIHQVPIKSLPQEWLWCETWCDDVSKKTAKTIDLCNNPQTKEPKLKAALRIVPEWKEYDYEVKVLWDKVYKTNTREQIEYEPPNIETETIGARIKDEL